MLKITKNINNGVLMVLLEGKLDATTSRDFEKELNVELKKSAQSQ